MENYIWLQKSDKKTINSKQSSDQYVNLVGFSLLI